MSRRNPLYAAAASLGSGLDQFFGGISGGAMAVEQSAVRERDRLDEEKRRKEGMARDQQWRDEDIERRARERGEDFTQAADVRANQRAYDELNAERADRASFDKTQAAKAAAKAKADRAARAAADKRGKNDASRQVPTVNPVTGLPYEDDDFDVKAFGAAMREIALNPKAYDRGVANLLQRGLDRGVIDNVEAEARLQAWRDGKPYADDFVRDAGEQGSGGGPAKAAKQFFDEITGKDDEGPIDDDDESAAAPGDDDDWAVKAHRDEKVRAILGIPKDKVLSSTQERQIEKIYVDAVNGRIPDDYAVQRVAAIIGDDEQPAAKSPLGSLTDALKKEGSFSLAPPASGAQAAEKVIGGTPQPASTPKYTGPLSLQKDPDLVLPRRQPSPVMVPPPAKPASNYDPDEGPQTLAPSAFRDEGFTVSSGYRSASRNAAVGGKSTSKHTQMNEDGSPKAIDIAAPQDMANPADEYAAVVAEAARAIGRNLIDPDAHFSQIEVPPQHWDTIQRGIKSGSIPPPPPGVKLVRGGTDFHLHAEEKG